MIRSSTRAAMASVRRSDEDAEGIVRLRNGPGAGPGLGQVDLTVPAGHDDVGRLAADPGEAQPLPERNRRWQIIARNDGEGADGRWDGQSDFPGQFFESSLLGQARLSRNLTAAPRLSEQLSSAARAGEGVRLRLYRRINDIRAESAEGSPGICGNMREFSGFWRTGAGVSATKRDRGGMRWAPRGSKTAPVERPLGRPRRDPRRGLQIAHTPIRLSRL